MANTNGATENLTCNVCGRIAVIKYLIQDAGAATEPWMEVLSFICPACSG